MRCTICGDTVIEDEAIYERNPITLRDAIMHRWCARVAYEEMTLEEKERYGQVED